jgi:hypothetical protein
MSTETEAAFEAACRTLTDAIARMSRARGVHNRQRAAGVLQAARERHEAAATACRAEQEALQTAHAKAEREAALAPRRAAKAAQGNLDLGPASTKVEAHGVRGMQSTPWRRTFPSWAAFEAWAEKNRENITIHATREAE